MRLATSETGLGGDNIERGEVAFSGGAGSGAASTRRVFAAAAVSTAALSALACAPEASVVSAEGSPGKPGSGGGAAVRGIAFRTKGRRQGPITRLMSPGDVGERVKPFVFLDWFEVESFRGAGFPAHPHSGISTLTTLLQGAFDYGDSTGKSGTMPAGSVEWMQAGGGVWHWGNPLQGEAVRGYQLWVALPEALENGPCRSQYVERGVIPSEGPARVLLGAYKGVQSAIPYHEPITYLHVRLEPDQVWTYSPPAGHDVAWLAVHRGKLQVSGAVLDREMAVFEEGDGDIALRAVGAAELVIGSAKKHPHPLVCGSYSVHTGRDALARGEANIEVIGRTPEVMAQRRL